MKRGAFIMASNGTQRNDMEQRVITGVVIGAGSRGSKYASYATYFPEKMKIVALVDPKKSKRRMMAKEHDLPASKLFEDFSAFISQEKMADFVIIASPDCAHHEQAVQCAKLGYHILLEKPMATTEEHCKEIVQVCEDSGVLLSVCLVLRYLHSARTIKKLIASGRIGKVCHIQHSEPVGFWHFAHSFVRGEWRNVKGSSFSLLTKSCHYLDLLYYWMLPNKVVNISSMGSLYHFRPENKPKGASSRCIDCSVEQSCPYSALKVYHVNDAAPTWPTMVAVDFDETPKEKWKESLEEALRSGPYGRCAYECDNDVCDNQVVSMQFEDGATATLTMVAFSEYHCDRYTKVFGTLGELSWDEKQSHLVKCYDFKTKSTEFVCEENEEKHIPMRLRGHSGSEFYTIKSFVAAIASGNASLITTGPRASLEGHLLAFAAEKARLTKTVQNYKNLDF